MGQTLSSAKFKNNNTQSCLLMNALNTNNPFTSNYDLVFKNANSNLNDWTWRFDNKNRMNHTNLSILDYKLSNVDSFSTNWYKIICFYCDSDATKILKEFFFVLFLNLKII